MWTAYIYETMSGRLIRPIDLPAFSWNVTIGDCSLTTTPSHKPGEHDLGGMRVPWTALEHATTAKERRELLASDRHGIILLHRNPTDDPNTLGTPIVGGAIGPRQDTARDTSFSISSIMSLLAERYAAAEGSYASGPNHTSTGTLTYKRMSLRGIASEIGHLCTNLKPGGTLPIDWTYRAEQGDHDRTYEAWNIQNLSCKAILEKISGVINGPDMQFRPYLTDDQTMVRWRFEAGSDTDIYLGQNTIHRLAYSPYGGTIENLTIDHLGPIHRIYASGAGTDKAQICALAQDLTLVERADPYPLREMTYADSDTDKHDLLLAHAQASLEANRRPLMQIKGEIHVDDMDGVGVLHPLGSIWPGEQVELDIQGFPSLDDGIYTCRLMQIEGNETGTVNLTFDPIEYTLT